MAEAWLRLGAAVGGAVLGSYFGGIYFGLAGQGFLTSAGFMAGSILGSMIFPQKSDVKMPEVGAYPIQHSNKGMPVPIVYGTVRVAGNIIWMGDLQAYTIKHSAGGGGGKGLGGGDEAVSYETKYRRSFLIGVCEGPAHINRCWRGKTLIDINSFAQYSGSSNTGISELLDESYAEYKNMCCAYFENYDLGNSQALPNFVFEVIGGAFRDFFIVAKSVGFSQYVEKLTDNLDGTFTENAEVSQGMDGGGVAYDGVNGIYSWDGDFLEKFDVDLNVVTSWQTNGQKNMGAGAIKEANKKTGEVIVAVGRDISLLDSDGEVIWTTDAGSGAAWHLMSFTREGDILGSRISAAGVSGCFKLSKVDGSVLATYNDDSDDMDSLWDIKESPVKNPDTGTYDIITVGVWKGAKGVWSFPAIGGGLAEVVWSNVIVAALAPICVCCTLDGTVYVGCFGATNPAGSIHRYSLTGTYLNSYQTGNRVRNIAQRDYSNIVVTGEEGTNQDGHKVSLSILSMDLVYQRGYDYINVENLFSLAMPYIPVTDAEPSNIIKDLLTNTRYGAGISESGLDLTSFAMVNAYCVANDLEISLSISEQKPLWDWIDYICSHFGGYRYRSGGKICLGVFRDESSVFTLTRDNLVTSDSKDSSPPVQIRKRKYTETFNRIEIQWTDRDADYDTSIAVANDEVDQRISGQVRKRTINLAGITDATMAQKMAYRMLIESMYRHSLYAFTLAYKDMLLEVNDVGVLTDGFLLTSEKIRITSVSEDKDGKGLSIEAIEDGSRLYPDIIYSSQQTERAPPTVPTLVNARIMFRENLNGGYLHLSIVPGNALVNGYNIYRSYDDSSYEFMGRATIDGITGGDSNSYGTLENNLPAYPSVVYRREEKIVVDIGTITDFDTAITDDTFFDGHKILRIGNELIGYHNCEEVVGAPGVWEITGLIRGMYNTLPVAHSPGEVVGTLDTDFTYILSEADIGKTIYFKAQVFYASQTQNISVVTAYNHSVSGKYLKPLPVSLVRINGREGLTTYKTDDVTVDWFYCSKVSGFGRGGYGNALWGAYVKDPLLSQFRIEIEEEDETPITDAMVDVDVTGEPNEYEVTSAMRDGKNPVNVKITPASHLLADEAREVLIEKI